MAIDAGLRAQMTHIVSQARALEAEKVQLDKDLPMWTRRVELALSKGMDDLARQAREKAEALAKRAVEIETQLDILAQERDMLRYQARRPSGEEVARAEMMLEEVRLGGLVDPDKAKMERELKELVSLDFGDES